MENSSAIDRISNLPNDILCHILSFLPTKLAFTTTVLSKRWKLPLFKLLTTFHFDDESFSNKMAFPRFIDIVMLFALPIKTFHLKFLEYLETYNVYYIEEQGEGVRLKTLTKLTRANIDASDVPIKAIHNVHFLKLKMPGMSQPKINSYCRDFLALQNLIHLELCFYDIGDVFKVLQNCPKLQILSIIKWSYLHNQDLHRNWKNPNLVPKCISSHLRSCTLRYIG
ncbi:F-box/FBD/LRR-repeat protein [Trifolium repens]|nr:F-box/FBD/LRR-repeat protein [Trifolium repens]